MGDMTKPAHKNNPMSIGQCSSAWLQSSQQEVPMLHPARSINSFRKKSILIVHMVTFVMMLLLITTNVLNASQVSLTWSAEDAAGYRLYYGTTSRTYSWVVDTGSMTSYTVQNLSAGPVYYFAVKSYDSSGHESSYSNEVSFNTGSCTYTISSSSITVPATGTSGNLTVTTQAGCTWTATTGVDWVTIISGASGSNSGSVAYTVAPNTTGASRSATFTVAGQIFSITQNAGQVFAISASAGTGGAVSPSGTTSVVSGGQQAYAITPTSGYGINKVLIDGTSIGAASSYTFTSVKANHTISATFTKTTTYSLTLNKTGTGTGTVTTSPTGTNFAAGTVVTVTATPVATSIFTGWSGACIGTSTTCKLTMYSAKTVTAKFTAKKYYTISAATTTGGKISPIGTSYASSGTNLTYTVTPSAGYKVKYILVDDLIMNWGATSYTFRDISTNHTITAYFTKL